MQRPSHKGSAVRRVYVLIHTVEEKAAGVASAVRSMRGVITADIVSGAYSIIAIVECENTQSVARLTLWLIFPASKELQERLPAVLLRLRIR